MNDSSVISLVKNLLKESLADGKLDVSEIVKISMVVVEKSHSIISLSYPEKKKYLVRTVEAALKESLTAAQLSETGAQVALDMLPTVLDIANNAITGKFDFTMKGLEKTASSCLVSCFSAAAVKDVKSAVGSSAALNIFEPVVVPVKPEVVAVKVAEPEVVAVKVAEPVAEPVAAVPLASEPAL
jgi:hypothetical protein